MIAPGGAEASSKGLAAKMKNDGTLSWAYLFSIPCEGLTLDSKQERALFSLKFPNRGLELHNYNLDSGGKDYIYEFVMGTDAQNLVNKSERIAVMAINPNESGFNFQSPSYSGA